ncbi:bifunctional protein-serine/threonine kinase/phosphatase [Alteraurantiacibacter aquimixticola]|uniref:Bifunctional protein-serine/threonine kinase/phosphatase n=1 Tax=Alteraurantiacibacter aquimixticola TaxID=2489173 RepID=A0A4T3F465_9SPHN|nr:bifunctional protein-serine/threonine kinase/phosphatase [Alteraurantiacibacter aquimixticola]TIX51229.1 bifunctional protein-serine/threonine kinase/phosphatase [Alteraurantiacibacter aquimixticola]
MTRQTLAISLGQYSSAGTKAENQDFHGALTPDGADLATKGIALALADGISTSRRGAEAAAIAVNSFLTDYFCTSEGWSVRKSGECVIGATNSWMHAENARYRPREEGEDREAAGLICTLSAIVFKSRSAHIFHVGDAQVLRLTGRQAEVLTTEHRIHLGGGESYLGRAMGANPQLEVEYRKLAVEAGDIFLLSTDGVHEFVGTADLLTAIEQCRDLDEAAKRLADLAADRGSGDNLTVQIARVESLPQGDVGDLLGGDLRLAPAPVLEEGQDFEGYRILRQLHSGPRSHAYLARHAEDDADVVIKVPSTERSQDADALAGLLLEEWVMRRLDHPNLLSAVPLHAARAHVFSVSRHVSGRTLHQWILDNAPGQIAPVRRIVNQVSAGLEAMHRREMLHRDLRPHNIMIDESGHATIIDFGSTQVAGLDEIAMPEMEDAAYAGTIQYSAPELYLGEAASVASDVFSLGVIAYHMLTGSLPYGARVSAADTARAQRKLAYIPAASRNPDIPEWVDAALARAVAVDPAKRYATPAEFVSDLARPNPELLRNTLPLLQRGSLNTWRLIALVLAAALVISIITRPDFAPSRPPAEKEESDP